MTDLYKWKKHETRLKARMKDSDSIQAIHQWLRKVENVTDTAINKACKDDSNLGNDRHNSNKNRYLSSQNLNNHTDAYSEANELLSKWMTDKIRLDMDDDIYNYVNITEMNKFEQNSRYLDEILNEKSNENSTTGLLHIPGIDYDKYDEAYIAKDIVNEMMRKKYVDPEALLRLDAKQAKNGVDVRAKIELRHQQVKDNREKRLKDLEEKRKAKLAKTEAELQAKQLVMKEERDKKTKMNIEQQLLELEVDRLRKEMTEQRRKEETLKQRQQEIEINRIERENQEYLNKKRLLEIENTKVETEARRNEIEEKRNEELLQSYLKAKNRRMLQKTFSAWFDIVIDSKLKSGKARALYDWKISYKYFNAWKKINLTDKIRKAQKVQEDVIKNENIKMSKAVNYCNMKLRRRCFETWQGFVRSEQLNKQILEEKNKAKSKIEMFLEAATQGKLNNTSVHEDHSENTKNNSHNQSINNKKQLPPKSHRSTRSTATTPKARPKSALDTSMRTPSTQRNNDMTLNDVDQFDSSDLALNVPDTERDALMSRQVRKMMWPWVKTPFVINNFENRYKAHDKLLQEQQKMIKEQQRVIEELKYQQGQMAFKEQITLLEQIKQKQEELERMQKAQYNQEKKLLMEAAYAKNHVKFRDQAHEASSKPLEATNNDETNEISESEVNQTAQHDVTMQNEQSKYDTTATHSAHNTSAIDTSKTPRFLKAMDERAKQREQIKREREDRKKQQDMEKLKQMQEKQEEKMRFEEDERRKKNEDLKEKRRIEKDLKDKREAEKIREEIMNKKADNFYKKYLMRHYCLNGFKKLLEIREQKHEMAKEHHNRTVFRKCFNAWISIVNEQVSIKNHIADTFYKKYLVRHYFVFGWKNFKMRMRIEEAKAVRFYKYNLKLKMFHNIQIYTKNEKLKYKEYDSWLDKYSKEKLKLKYYKKWKEFPDEMKKQREREKRLNEMRRKVQELVPDFHLKASLSESTVTSTNQSTTLSQKI